MKFSVATAFVEWQNVSLIRAGAYLALAHPRAQLRSPQRTVVVVLVETIRLVAYSIIAMSEDFLCFLIEITGVPLEVGGRIIGAIIFVANKRRVIWTEHLVKQLRVLAADASLGRSGTGFDLEEGMKASGLGLISMVERLKLVNGQLSIDSHPETGTAICARVPLRKAARAAG